MLPKTIHEYEFINVLFKRDNFSVYQVFSNKYQIHFICKVISLKESPEYATIQQYNEVFALRSINHPNVLRLYDYFKDNDIYYMIYENLSRDSLEKEISVSNTIKMPRLKTLALEMILAIEQCHRQKIAHCNLNPGCFYFAPGNRLKLIEFQNSQKVNCDMIIPMPCLSPYQPLEVLERNKCDPFKVDIWSMGIMFYQMATGNIPFNGPSIDSLKMKIGSVANLNYPKTVHPEFVDVIKCMLVLNPKNRSSADQLLAMPFFRDDSISKLPKVRIARSSPQMDKIIPMTRTTKNFEKRRGLDVIKMVGGIVASSSTWTPSKSFSFTGDLSDFNTE